MSGCIIDTAFSTKALSLPCCNKACLKPSPTPSSCSPGTSHRSAAIFTSRASYSASWHGDSLGWFHGNPVTRNRTSSLVVFMRDGTRSDKERQTRMRAKAVLENGRPPRPAPGRVFQAYDLEKPPRRARTTVFRRRELGSLHPSSDRSAYDGTCHVRSGVHSGSSPAGKPWCRPRP